MVGTNHDSKSSSGQVRLAMVVGPDTMRRMGRVIQHLAIGLLDEPMVVTMVAPETADTSNLPTPPVQIQTYPHARLGYHRTRTLDALTDWLTGHHIELLHSMDGSAHPLTRKLSNRGDWPYFVSVGDLTQCRRIRPVGEHCQSVLAGSTMLRDAVLAASIMPADRVHLLRPGVHPTGPPDCFSHRDRSTAIIAGGDLSDRAAADAVLESFAALQAGPHECVFFIMGNRKSEHRLRSRARDLKLTHELTFVGRMGQYELPGILAAADAFVFPRSDQTLEIEILEAMAAGTAVLVGDKCVGDFVIESETALAYDAASGQDLTDKLNLLIEQPQVAVRMATKALGHLRAYHSPAAMASTLARLYGEYALRGRMLKI